MTPHLVLFVLVPFALGQEQLECKDAHVSFLQENIESLRAYELGVQVREEDNEAGGVDNIFDGNAIGKNEGGRAEVCKDDTQWQDNKYGGTGADQCNSGAHGGIVANPDWCTEYGEYSAAARRACPVACGLCDEGKEALRVDSTVIGSSLTPIDGSTCWDNTCEYGIMLCDVLLKYGRMMGYAPQIALYNGGGIRASLPEGNITLADIDNVHPYGDNTTFFKLKGHVIEQLLLAMLDEHGPPGNGKSRSWLQLSGLRFQATWNETAWRLHNVLVHDAESGAYTALDPDGTYSIVSNSYIRFGSSNRSEVSAKAEPIEDNGPSIMSFITTYLLGSSPVSAPAMDDRSYLANALTVVGETLSPISGLKEECRENSCSEGIILCEEMLLQGRRAGYGTQIALFNSGDIYSSLPQGSITVADLLRVHPFGDVVSFFILRGDVIELVLLDMLKQHGAPGNGSSGGWLQFAGLRFQATYGAGAWKLQEVQVQDNSSSWFPLHANATYSIAANSHVRFGKGGHDLIRFFAEPLKDDGPSILSIMISFFEANSPVSPPLRDQRECFAERCMWQQSASCWIGPKLLIFLAATISLLR